MQKYFNIKIGFALIIFLLVFLVIVAVDKIDTVTEQTKKIHDHPFKVSRAAITINSHLISMHRYMKDVVLSTNKNELEISIKNVNYFEELILTQYGIIFKQYLGKREDIEDSFHTFINWKPIREEVILLVSQNKIEEAANITKYKGAKYVLKLNNKVQILVNFASNKADEFYYKSIKYVDYAKKIILIILLFLIIIAILISKFTIDNFKKSMKERDKYLKKIEEISITDALTTLHNRRHFDDSISRYLKKINRLDEKIVFIMFDIDNFKKYNDNYGHKTGDKALQKISTNLKENFKREDDYLFRIGGEEFAMLFIINDTAAVNALCKDGIESITDLNIEHKYNEPYGIITVSMGVGIIDNKNNLDENFIYEKVDKLLYKAKHDGKNIFKIDNIS